ncbi:MAG: Hsp70 family protein [Proteobacteria bacterium]|nr:Hsp70 family protein [Pseudomonadota bacterium]
MSAEAVLGLDFGTTNTVAAIGRAGRPPVMVRIPFGDRELTAFRSLLSFREPERVGQPVEVEGGLYAAEQFAADPTGTRLIQSFKTYAASRTFRDTDIYGKRWRFEDLMAALLMRLRAHAGERLETLPRQVIVGRPVTFAGADPDPALAEERYRTALGRFGFNQLEFVYEPVGAAFFYARELQREATVLVADFGGGTSDFSLVRFIRAAGGRFRTEPLGHAGVGVAGDAFDYRIIDRVVSPRLGKGTDYRSGDKRLPVPYHYYAAFARWNQLAILKHTRVMRDIRSVAREAVDAAALAAFVDLLEHDQGYPLYRAVSATKEALSAADAAPFTFSAGRIAIETVVERADFEAWIAPELAAIAGALDRALDDAGRPTVDRVFLTGGSSFVPAVRRLFIERFGEDRIESGSEFESIAVGLAVMGAEKTG